MKDMMKKYVKKRSIRKGLTLIELVVSIAILAIISVGILTMFSNGYINIGEAGKRSDIHYEVQNLVESNISDPAQLTEDVDTNTESLELNFSGTTYNVEGRKIEVTYKNKSKTNILTTFTAE